MAGLTPFYRLIHDFLIIFLPNEQKCSENTIRSYRKSLEMLLDYVKTEKNIRLDEITFDMIDRQTGQDRTGDGSLSWRPFFQ